MKRLFFLCLLFLMQMSAQASAQQTHIVKMWSDGAIKYFHPEYLRVNVCDTVQFINMKGNHNTEAIEGMIPKGAEYWASDLNETYDLLITHEGVWGYMCTPHLDKGMVGLIVAGDASINLDTARLVETTQEADRMFQRLFAKLD